MSDREESEDQATPSVGSSDAWEDTSDPGDDSVDGDSRDDNDDTFQGRKLSSLFDSGQSSERLQSRRDLLPEPLTPRGWLPEPSANSGSPYSSETRRTIPPLGGQ